MEIYVFEILFEALRRGSLAKWKKLQNLSAGSRSGSYFTDSLGYRSTVAVK